MELFANVSIEKWIILRFLENLFHTFLIFWVPLIRWSTYFPSTHEKQFLRVQNDLSKDNWSSPSPKRSWFFVYYELQSSPLKALWQTQWCTTTYPYLTCNIFVLRSILLWNISSLISHHLFCKALALECIFHPDQSYAKVKQKLAEMSKMSLCCTEMGKINTFCSFHLWYLDFFHLLGPVLSVISWWA